MNGRIRLADDQLEALAAMVAERLRDTPRAVPEMVDAAALAGILGVSRDAVYAAADDLGAVRVGKPGSLRPRVMFDVQTALARRNRAPAPTPRPQSRSRRSTGDVKLLPIKGRAA